jgi:hypothetical protein
MGAGSTNGVIWIAVDERKTTPVGADKIVIQDSAAGDQLKYILVSDVEEGTADGKISISIDGSAFAITTGVKGDLVIPFTCTINSVTLLADQSGSIAIDIWKDTYANYPPTDADSITASAVPTITTDTDSQDTTLTGWTTALTKGDTLRFNVDSCTSITRVTLHLQVTKG